MNKQALRRVRDRLKSGRKAIDLPEIPKANPNAWINHEIKGYEPPVRTKADMDRELMFYFLECLRDSYRHGSDKDIRRIVKLLTPALKDEFINIIPDGLM